MKTVWNPEHNRQILVSAVVLISILSVFGLVVFLSANSENPSNNIPSPSPADFSAVLGQKMSPQPGQIQNANSQILQFGPKVPSATPSPVPTPAPTPTATPTATSTPSPSASTSPTPASTP